VRASDEIIVVDDGSSDNTLSVLQAFGDRINVVSAQHKGAGAARNLGIQLARNEWVAFLDSDDEWDKDKIELQRPLLKHFPHVAFVFTNFRVCMPDGQVHGQYLGHWSKDTRPWDEILGPPQQYGQFATLPVGRTDFNIYEGSLYRQLLFRPYLAAFTYIFRKDQSLTPPTFAVDLPTLEDWQFFAQVAKRGNGLYMDCETATQHGHLGRRLTDAAEVDTINARLTIMARVWGSDEVFMRDSAQAYYEARRTVEQRRDFLVGRDLALAGKIVEARSIINNAGPIPWKYRVLFQFPNFVVRAVAILINFVGVG
jgi:glycosyltransferase involved in cell wall biosynthesis